MGVHTLNPAPRRHRQADLCAFKTSQGYLESPCLKNNYIYNKIKLCVCVHTHTRACTYLYEYHLSTLSKEAREG